MSTVTGIKAGGKLYQVYTPNHHIGPEVPKIPSKLRH